MKRCRVVGVGPNKALGVAAAGARGKGEGWLACGARSATACVPSGNQSRESQITGAACLRKTGRPANCDASAEAAMSREQQKGPAAGAAMRCDQGVGLGSQGARKACPHYACRPGSLF